MTRDYAHRYRVVTNGRLFRVERYSAFRAWFSKRWAWWPVEFVDYRWPMVPYRTFSTMAEACDAMQRIIAHEQEQRNGWREVGQ